MAACVTDGHLSWVSNLNFHHKGGDLQLYILATRLPTSWDSLNFLFHLYCLVTQPFFHLYSKLLFDIRSLPEAHRPQMEFLAIFFLLRCSGFTKSCFILIKSCYIFLEWPRQKPLSTLPLSHPILSALHLTNTVCKLAESIQIQSLSSLETITRQRHGNPTQLWNSYYRNFLNSPVITASSGPNDLSIKHSISSHQFSQ